MQFLIFLTVAGLLSAIFFARKETLSRKEKIIIFLVLGAVVLSGWAYEVSTTKTNEKNRAVLNAFKQEKVIYCNGIEISSENFIFVNGTLSFIANKKNSKQKGLVIDIATCKMDK